MATLMRQRLRAASLVLAAVLISGCGSASSRHAPTRPSAARDTANPTSHLKTGGTINFPLYADPVSITPLHGQESEGVQVEKSLFAGLVDYDPTTLETIPSIATRWSSNAKATVWTFHLRRGVYFQPRRYGEVTADTFVEDWGIVCAKDTASEVSYILAPIQGFTACTHASDHVLAGVRARDRYTLRVRLAYPFADFPATLGHPVSWAFPPQLADTPAKEKAFERHPVGAGPFSFVRWDHGKELVIERNPDFFGQRAHIDAVHFSIFPGVDAEAALLAFKAGKLDYATIPSGELRAVKSDPRLGRDYFATRELALYFYGFTLKGSNPVAHDRLLRQAISYATDSRAVVADVEEGVDKVADGLVPPGVPGYRRGVSPYRYEPRKAAQLLRRSGFHGPLTLSYNTGPDSQRIAEALIQGYREIGLDMRAENFEWGTFIDKLAKGELPFWRSGWIADYPSMDDFIYPMFDSKEAGNNNNAFYRNPEVDRMLVAARAQTDAQKRYALYTHIEKVILADAPEIPIYFYSRPGVVSPQAEDFTYDAMGIARFNLMGVDRSRPAT